MAVASELSVLIKADTKGADAALSKIGGSISSMGGNLTKLGAPAIGAVGAIAGIGVASVKAAGDFQTQMKQVETLGADFGRPFTEVEQQVSELAKRMGVDATDAATTLYNAVSAGVPAGNALEFMEAATKAAVGGAAELSQVGSAMSVVMNSWGDAAGSATDVTDGLFQVVKMGVTTMPELASAIGGVSGIASAAGVSFKDTGAAIAQITTKGKTTSVAVTQLKGILGEMMKPGKELAGAFNALGFETGTAALGALGLDGVIAELAKHAEATGKPLNTLFGGIEAGAGALDLAANNADDYNQKIQGMWDASGNAEAALDKVNEGWQRQVDLLKGQVSGTLRDIGMAMLPALTDALKDAMPAIQGLMQTAADFGTTFADAFGAAARAMSDGGGLTGGIDAFLSSFGVAGSTINEVVGYVRTFQEVIGKVAGFISEHRETILKFGAAFAAISAAAAVLGPPLMLIGMLISGLAPIVGAVGAVIGGLVGVIGTIAGAIGAVVPIITTFAALLGGPITIGIIAVIAAFALWKAKGDEIKAAVAGWIASIKANWEEFVTGTKEKWDAATAAVTGALEAIASVIRLQFDAFLREISSKLDSILGAVETAWTGVQTAITIALDILKDAITTAWNGYASLIKEVLGRIEGVILSALDAIERVFGVKLDLVYDVVQGAFSAIFNVIDGDMGAAWDRIKKVLGLVWDEFSSKIGGLAGKVNDWFGRPDGLLGKIEAKINDFLEVGTSIVDGIKKGVSEAWTAFVKWVIDEIKKLPGEILTAILGGSPARKFVPVGESMSQGIAHGFTTDWDKRVPIIKRKLLESFAKAVPVTASPSLLFRLGFEHLLPRLPGGVSAPFPGFGAGGAGAAPVFRHGAPPFDLGIGGPTARTGGSANAFRSGRGGFIAGSSRNFWRRHVDKFGIPDEKQARKMAAALGIPIPDWLEELWRSPSISPDGGGTAVGGVRGTGRRAAAGRVRRGPGPGVVPVPEPGENPFMPVVPGPPPIGSQPVVPPGIPIPPVLPPINVHVELGGQTLEVLVSKISGAIARDMTLNGQGG